jgi:alanine racemase
MINHENVGAILTIDLKAVANNWKVLASKMPSGTLCGAALKTDAYGLGAQKIASTLVWAGCKNYFVAYPFEGKAIRDVVGDQQIFVLNGLIQGGEADLVANDLIPVITSKIGLKQWSDYAKKIGKKLKAAIHVDTGMVRLGIPTIEFVEMLEDISVFDGVEPVLIMSHLACADEKENPKNKQQLELFSNIVIAFRKFFPNAKASFANSAGIYLGQEYHFDLARPGIGLYGGLPAKGISDLQPVISLKARILQIQDAEPPQTIGYGASYKLDKKRKIATAAIGYGDGYFRSLSNSGIGYIENQPVPAVGRVSMDLTTFDITDVNKNVNVGDYIDIINSNNTLEALANEAKTINYEVLTNLGKRYFRKYIGEAY